MKGLFEHGGNLYAAWRQKGGQLDNYLDFSANINPLGMPESARQAVLAALPYVIHYPDAASTELKEAISRKFKVGRELITVGNGAAELLYVLCQMFRPQRVLVPAPTFSEYERAARAAGAAVEYLPLSSDDGFAVIVEKIFNRIPDVDIVFLGNPNNPTGRMLSRQELEEIIAMAKKYNVLVVVDESFIEFLPDAEDYSCRGLLTRYANLIILQSLTKFYAIPGLRLGFVLADPAIGKMLDKGKDTWNVNSLAQAAGVAALADIDYQQASLKVVSSAREEFFTALQNLPGLKPFPSSANFLLVNIAGGGYTAASLGAALLDRDIMIRDCSNYPGLSADYIRLAVKMPSDNQKLLDALQILLEGGD